MHVLARTRALNARTSPHPCIKCTLSLNTFNFCKFYDFTSLEKCIKSRGSSVWAAAEGAVERVHQNLIYIYIYIYTHPCIKCTY